MKVEKVTISLPPEVYAWGEAERAKSNQSRSQFVARLYRDRMYQQELEVRARQYEKAYREQPYTEEENAWAEMSQQMLYRTWAEDDAATPKAEHQAANGRRTKRGARRSLVDAVPSASDS